MSTCNKFMLCDGYENRKNIYRHIIEHIFSEYHLDGIDINLSFH